MTISSETRKAGPFPGNGVTTAFPFAFKVFVAADVSATLTTLATGAQTTLTLNTDYTLSLNADQNANPGGTVTYNPGSVPMPSTQTLTLGSVVTKTQGTHITNGGAFLPNNIEDMVDRAVINVQQSSEKIDRSIKFPIVDVPLTVELPTAAIRANKGMKFDANGNVTITVNDADSAASSAAASASAAATSATASAGSATAAAGSASAASGSATAASTSAATAQAAAQAQLWRDVVFKTFADSPITIAAADRGKFFSIDASGGAVVINLPQISTLDLSVAWAVGIKKEDSSGNSLTINRAGTDTIDGVTSKTIGVAGAGTTLIPDTDPTPDMWTAADFGATAGNMTVDVFSGTGAQTVFALSVAPGSKNNVHVLVGGVPQFKSTYSVTGTTLTFNTAPPTGASNIEATSGTTLSIGTPADGTVTAAKLAANAAPPGMLINGYMVDSEAANALTIAINNDVGSAPSSSNPVVVRMRSGTLASGQMVTRQVIAATALTLRSGDTLGHNSGLPGLLWRYLIDNAGTLELAVSGKFFGNEGVVSTTAITGGALTSGTTMYSTTARASVAFICIGWSWDTQAAAGTWATAPSELHPTPFTPPLVSFLAHKNSANQTFASATLTKLTWGSQTWNNGGLFASDKWTPPPGSVSITTQMRTTGTVDQVVLELLIYKNGAQLVTEDRQASGAAAQSASISRKDECNGTDYYEMFVFQTGGGTYTVDGSPTVTSFMGEWAPRRS